MSCPGANTHWCSAQVEIDRALEPVKAEVRELRTEVVGLREAVLRSQGSRETG